MGELWTIIQRHLDETGVREAEFARRIGTSPTTVNSWKNRGVRSLPDRKLLDAVADVTGTKYSDVLRAVLTDAGYADGTIRLGRTHHGAWELGPELMVELAMGAKGVESTAWQATSFDEDDDVEEVISAAEDLAQNAEDLAETAERVAELGMGGAQHLQLAVEQERRRRRAARVAAREAGRRITGKAKVNVDTEHPTEGVEASEYPFAQRLGVADVLTNYNITSDQPLKAVWDAGYRFEDRDFLRSALAAASAKSDKRSGQWPGDSKFWEAFALELGGTYGWREFALPGPDARKSLASNGSIQVTAEQLRQLLDQYRSALESLNDTASAIISDPVGELSDPTVMNDVRAAFERVTQIVADAHLQFHEPLEPAVWSDLEAKRLQVKQQLDAAEDSVRQAVDRGSFGYDLAARRGPGRSKGERLHDEMSAAGEESQVDPGEGE